MRTFEADTLSTLHDDMCRAMALAKRDELDYISSIDVHVQDVVAVANSMQWRFDLKEHWLTKTRWNTLVKQYVDPPLLVQWLTKSADIGHNGRGYSFMRTKAVATSKGGRQDRRKWGACILGVGYRAKPRPQIVLMSRTSYLGYLGALDLSVAWVCGRYLGEIVGVPVEDMAFTWHLQGAQYHGFKSVAHLLCHHDEEEQAKYRRLLLLEKDKLSEKTLEGIKGRPGLHLTRTWVQKVLKLDAAGQSYGLDVYGPYRRIRRRLHTEVFGPEYGERFAGYHKYKNPQPGDKELYIKPYRVLPSCPSDTLDFAKATGVGLRSVPDGSYEYVEQDLPLCPDCGLPIEGEPEEDE